MIRLDANAEHAGLAHGVAAAGDIANLRRGHHQVFVAHDFGDGGGHFGKDGPAEGCCRCSPVVASSRMRSRNSPTVRLFMGAKASGLKRVEKQARHLVVRGIDQRMAKNFVEGSIGELSLCGDAFAFRACGYSGQLIAGFFLVGLGEELAEIGEIVVLGHKSRGGCRLALRRAVIREASQARSISGTAWPSDRASGAFVRIVSVIRGEWKRFAAGVFVLGSRGSPCGKRRSVCMPGA